METRKGPSPLRKPVVKRNASTPWKLDLSMKTKKAAHKPPSSSMNGGSGSSQLGQTVGSPTAAPEQPLKPGGLASSKAIQALQRDWEQRQKQNDQGLALAAFGQDDTTASDSSETDTDTDPETSDGDSKPAQGPAAVNQASVNVNNPSQNQTPVPIPSYANAASAKRSAGSSPSMAIPPPKRIQTGTNAHQAGSSAPTPTPMDEARRLAEATALQAASAVTPQQTTPAPPASEPSRISRSDGSGNDTPSSTAINAYQHTVNEVVDQSGRIRPVLHNVEGRPYSHYQAPGEASRSAIGAIIPKGYKLLDDPDAPYVCPVRDCRQSTDVLRALGGHFISAHACMAFNDNGDGTLTSLFKYDAPRGEGPGVVVSTEPLSPSGPPPAVPQMTRGTRNRLLKRPQPRDMSRGSRRTSYRMETASDSMSGTNSVASPTFGTPLTYLLGFLSESQTRHDREDIRYMATLPMKRELPDAWLRQHQGDLVADANHYASALAYIVGDELEGPGKCNRYNTKSVWTARLSDRCIILPDIMPEQLKQAFHKTKQGDIGQTCVGCKYYSALQRRQNECSLITRADMTERESEEPREEQTESMRMVVSDLGHATLVGNTRKEKSSEPQKLPSTTIRRLPASPIVEHGVSGDDSGMRMEEWERTPGRQLDSAVVALSARYLSGPQPITISDDISIQRLRILSGESHRWPAKENSLRVCEVISGKIDFKYEGQTTSIGPGGVFIVRPEKSCLVSNYSYQECVVSLHLYSNYTFVRDF